MNEAIIFSKSIDQNRFLRSLSKINKPTFNVRVYKPFALCDEALMRRGVTLNVPLIKKQDEPLKILEILDRLNDKHFSSYKDIKHLANTIREIRQLVIVEDEISYLESALNEYLKDENISLIMNVLKEYLSDNSFIDYVGYIRKAVKEAKGTFKEIICFNEENISPLEKKLLKELSNNNVKEISIIDYLNLEKKKDEYEVNPYYGIDNEIEEVVTDVYKKKIPADEVNIILANSDSYTSSLYKLAKSKNIPLAFLKGVPIIHLNPYKLFSTLRTLENVNQFDVNGYRYLFASTSFKKTSTKTNDKYLIEILGRLKISFDKEDNEKKINRLLHANNFDFLLEDIVGVKYQKEQIIKELCSFIDDMSLGMKEFLLRHVLIGDSIDEAALNHIIDRLDKSASIKNKDIRNTYLDEVANINVCPSTTSEGCINVLAIDNAFSNIRKHNYLLGLSANNFPGKAKENYLINDEQLLLINKAAITSVRNIENKNKLFDDLLSFISSLNNNLKLSYSFYNLVEPNEINPSSKIFEIVSKYQEDYLKNKKRQTTFFSSEVNCLKGVGEAFLDNKKIIRDVNDIVFPIAKDNLLEQPYSPSSIDLFFDCPKKFFIQRILSIQLEQPYDRYNVIDSNHFGTLIHYALEKYHALDEKDFIEQCKALFSDYLCLNVPLKNVSEDEEEYLKCATNGYNYLKDFTDLIFETKIEAIEDDVKLSGRFDCRAKRDGKEVLIDFKTDRRIKRDTSDLNSIRQILLYLLMNKNNGINIHCGEYYYLRYDKRVPVFLNTDSINFLKSNLFEFKTALTTRTFKISKNKSCNYCPINGLCSKKEGQL